MKGVPLNTVTTLLDHLEKKASQRKMEYTRAKDTRAELPSQFFTAMIKQEEDKRTIRAIHAANGSVMTSHENISTTMTTHFRQLYSSWPADYKLRTHCLVLLWEVIKTLGEGITVREALEVVNSKSPSSAPELDGLSYQVYTLVPALMNLLVQVC